MSTGEDWYKIMFDTTREKNDNCILGVSCGSKFNTLFFIFFIIFV